MKFRGKHTKPIAFFKLKNKTIMKKSKVKTRGIKDLTTTTAAGDVLDFGDQVNSIEEIEVGMTAKIIANETNPGGGVPDGEYVMPDRGTWVFVKGTLTEMIEPDPEDEPKTMGSNIFGEKVVYQLIKGRFFVRAQKKISRSPGKPITGV